MWLPHTEGFSRVFDSYVWSIWKEIYFGNVQYIPLERYLYVLVTVWKAK